MHRFALIAAAVALTLPAAPALAGGHSWQVGNNSYHLYFNDLDLHSAEGRAQALARVETAAGRLCGQDGVRSEIATCKAQILRTASQGAMSGVLQLAQAERAGSPVTLAQAQR